jgi:hypothetical protein
MNFIHILKLMVLGLVAVQAEDVAVQAGEDCVERKITRDFIIGEYVYQLECVGFTAGEGTYGTGICEYCQEQLGTTKYSFLHGVHPAPVGCSTLPIPGRQYVCCTI